MTAEIVRPRPPRTVEEIDVLLVDCRARMEIARGRTRTHKDEIDALYARCDRLLEARLRLSRQ